MKRQEGTMQLRHIRPGSLEWQDAQTEEAEQGSERLTPEEISRLRRLTDEGPMAGKQATAARPEMH
jgi:hypothetical protein